MKALRMALVYAVTRIDNIVEALQNIVFELKHIQLQHLHSSNAIIACKDCFEKPKDKNADYGWAPQYYQMLMDKCPRCGSPNPIRHLFKS